MDDIPDKVSALFDGIEPPSAPELLPEQAWLLEVLGDGWSEREIAGELSAPIAVVRTCLDEIVGTLRARSLMHALAIAFRLGLLPLERRQVER